MKFLLNILLIIIFSTQFSVADWQYKYNGQGITTSAVQGDLMFLGRVNGITQYNSNTKEMKNYNSTNSELKGNYVSSMLPLEDGSILVSTNRGLSIIKNGIIISDEKICTSYPDEDARKLYKSANGTIWTYSANKVNCYRNGIWKSIDLTDSVRNNQNYTYPFDIWDLFIHGDEVWAKFNDNNKTSTRYYNTGYNDYEFRFAIVNENGIVRTFQDNTYFTMDQGGYSFTNIGDTVYWAHRNYIYQYDGKYVRMTEKLNSGKLFPYSGQDFYKDKDGNIWYIVYDGKSIEYCLVKYDILTNQIIRYDVDPNTKINGLRILDDGTITAYSYDNIYVKNGDNWIKYDKIADLGLTKYNFIYPFTQKINNKIYVQIYGSQFNYPMNSLWGSLMCLEDKSLITPISFDFPYRMLSLVEVNAYGKGVYEGFSASTEPLMYEADSAFTNLTRLSIGYISKIKLADDKNIYFNNFRLNTQTGNAPFLASWNGNEIIKIDMGFSDKENVDVVDFDSKDNLLYAIGSYQSIADSMNMYLSVYNIKDKSLIRYDKTNSDLPDWYWWHSGIYYVSEDTVPRLIQVDNDYNAWILTTDCLIKFKPGKSEKFSLPKFYQYIYFDDMQYDSKYGELVFTARNSSRKIWYFNTSTVTWDSLDLENAGIKGELIRRNIPNKIKFSIKKLLDKRIYASDDLGYLYKYAGQGRFQMIDLDFFGRINTDFTINDFCIGGDGKFYIGTDIGLFWNDNLNSVEEKNITNTEDSIYPNPAADYITIDMNKVNPQVNPWVEDPVLRIYDVFGNKVLVIEEQSIASQQKIDVSTLPTGTYLLRIKDTMHKFMVMR